MSILLHSRCLLAAGLAALAIITASTAQAATAEWRLQASETLVRLSGHLLDKSINQDFLGSALGQALAETDGELALTTQTLGDLKAAIARAEGDVRIDLRHQFLGEKREWLNLMSRRADMRRIRVETEVALYEDMLAELNRGNAAMMPARQELIVRQDAAAERLESSLAAVDNAVLHPIAVPQSRYQETYAENISAIEALAQAIEAHHMNPSAGAAGPLTRIEHIRAKMVEAEAQLAILDQEETMLGYMAKLVALDALALSEEALDAELADSDLPGRVGPAPMVELFID